MATCPSGHASASDDFCDVCGVLIGAAPELAFDGGPGSPGAASLASAQRGAATAAGGVVGGAGLPPAEACPRCGAPRAGQFCESCGYDFTASPAAPAPAPSAPPPPTVRQAPEAVTPAPQTVLPGAGASGASADWAVVVTADRAYFDSVQAAGGPDAAGLSFPAYYPRRQFPLAGTEVRIGRRSLSSGITPEIDLSVAPADPGVSRLHAVLLRSPDGAWAVMDPGSANGTLLNGSEIPEGQAVPVRPGDRIHVGAWTALSIVTEN